MKIFALQTVCTFYLVFTECLMASKITFPLIKEDVDCTPYDFRCNDGKCISQYDVCDIKKDCNDGEDEKIDLCLEKPCNIHSSFRCPNSGVCIPLTWLCDGSNDCGDNSDEVIKTCSKIMYREFSIWEDYKDSKQLEESDDDYSNDD